MSVNPTALSENQITLQHSNSRIHGEIDLTASKSESNRALIINALSRDKAKMVEAQRTDSYRGTTAPDQY